MHWENTVTAAFHLPQNELKINALGIYCPSCIPLTTKWTENKCIGNILSQLHSIYHKMNWKSMHWEYTVTTAFHLPQNELKINALGINCRSCIPFTTKWTENQCIGNILSQLHSIYHKMNWKSRIGNILPKPTSNTFGLRQNELKTAFLEDNCVESSVPPVWKVMYRKWCSVKRSEHTWAGSVWNSQKKLAAW